MEATANKDVAVLDNFPEKINDIKKAIDNLAATQTKVKELKEKYSGISIADENDEEGYNLARKAKSILVKTRTASVDDRKVALKPIDELRDNVYGEFVAVETELKTIEAPITSRIKEIDDIEKKRKEDEALAKEKKVEDRRNELVKKGMVFDEVSGYYVIKAPELGITETSIGIVDIRTMSDDLYSNFLQMIEDKSAKITAEKERVAAIEKKAEEEKEAAEKNEREDFAAQKKILDDQLAALKKQQEDMKASQDLLDQKKRDADLREQQAEQNRINDLIKHRSAVLVGLGMKYNQSGDTYTFEEIEVSTHWITTATEGAWVESVQDTTGKIQAKKDFAAKELELQQAADKKKKEEEAALAEKERLAGLSDKQKMQEYIKALLAVPVPPITTKTWKPKLGMVRDFINDNLPV